MERLLIAIALGGIVVSPSARGQLPRASGFVAENAPSPSTLDVPAIPPAPRGPSTIFGGAIATLDPVRDRLTLRLPSQRPMTIFFDERTKVFRNGKRVRLGELETAHSASVETTLEGSHLFALSIHLLSGAQQGEFQGRVVAYDAATGQMRVEVDGTSAPFNLRVSPETQIVREGQARSATTPEGTGDLVNGTLVSLDFIPSGNQTPAASQIRVLALPGMTFVFRGKVSSLDEHLGRMVLTDPVDEKSYQLFFNAASLPSSQELHLADSLRVTADYDGTHYVVRTIETTKP
jgi:hypothetical protein